MVELVVLSDVDLDVGIDGNFSNFLTAHRSSDLPIFINSVFVEQDDFRIIFLPYKEVA